MSGTTTKRKSTAQSATSRKKLKLSFPETQLTSMFDECLIHAFQYLDIVSLAKMARADQRIHDIITTQIIPNRTIDFSKVSKSHGVRKIFDLFGKYITRIVVSESDIRMTAPSHSKLGEFFRLLIKYGEPGKLKEVSLKFRFGCWGLPSNLFDIIAPYFANVNTLKLDMIPNEYQFLGLFLIEANRNQNLRTLRLHNSWQIGRWLNAELLANLRSIDIHFSSNRYWDDFLLQATNQSLSTLFILQKPATLTEFRCNGLQSPVVFDELSRHVPNVERLGVIKNWPNGGNNNGDNHGIPPIGGHSKWKYFNDFTDLKYVSLQSSVGDFSDFGEVFASMAKRNTIEELELTFGMNKSNRGKPDQIGNLARLTKLKTLHLINFNDEISGEFVDELFVHLPALTSCVIDGRRPNQLRIIEFIKMAKHLKVIKFNFKFSSLSVSFYKKRVKSRVSLKGQGADKENRLVIQCDRESVLKCVDKLGKRYQPGIIALQSN